MKWPEYWSPWYVVFWRLLWAIPFLVCLALFSVPLFFGWGPKAVRETWSEYT